MMFYKHIQSIIKQSSTLKIVNTHSHRTMTIPIEGARLIVFI